MNEYDSEIGATNDRKESIIKNYLLFFEGNGKVEFFYLSTSDSCMLS